MNGTLEGEGLYAGQFGWTYFPATALVQELCTLPMESSSAM